jgi:diguanylate cyclase (GGDEF)-like protein
LAAAGRKRLALVVTLTVLVLLALQMLLVWTAVDSAQRIGAAFRTAVQSQSPAVVAAQNLQRVVQNRMLFMLRMAAQPDPLDRTSDAAAFYAEREAFARELDRLRSLVNTPAARARLAEVLSRADELSNVQRDVVEALLLGEDARARALMQSFSVFEKQDRAIAALQRLAQGELDGLETALRGAQDIEAEARRFALALGAGLVVLGAAVGAVAARLTAWAARIAEREVRTTRAAAQTDPLTGLLNRRGLEAELARLCRARNGERGLHGVLVLDLDNFKPLNDSAGHQAGDLALREVAAALKRHVRPGDCVARIGGDEFAIVFRRAHGTACMAVAQRLIDAVGAIRVPGTADHIRLGASIGIAALPFPANERDIQTAFASADAACYRAKREGRNRACLADEPDSAVH